jgi:uncharacterized protein (TIGR03382 family)
MRRITVALLFFATPALATQQLGLNVHQSTGVGLDATRDAGLTWVRVDFNWLQAQPTSAAPDFTLFDQVVNGAKSRGLSVLATVGYTPAWASTGDTKMDGPNNDVPMAGTYDAFVSAVVAHFKDRVDHYELWNEPNLGGFWEGTSQQYIDLILKPGADAVHAACAACVVVGPTLATIGTVYADWLDAALTQAGDKIDVVSGHIYADFPSSGSTVGTTSDSFFNKLDSHRLVTVGGVTVYEGPLSFYEVLQKHAWSKPFWLDETGLAAAITDTTKLAAQTDYYKNVMTAMGARPWWDVTIFYEAFDEPPAMYYFGVVVDDAAAAGGYDKKPVFDYLKSLGGAPPIPDGGVVDAATPADAAVAMDAAIDEADAGNGGGGGNGGGNGNSGGTNPSGGSSGGCAFGGAPASGGLLLLAFAWVGRRRRIRR